MACLSDCRQVDVLCTYLHHDDHECTSMSSIYWWQFGIKPLQHDCKETRHSTSVSFKKVLKNQVSLYIYWNSFLIGEKCLSSACQINCNTSIHFKHLQCHQASLVGKKTLRNLEKIAVTVICVKNLDLLVQVHPGELWVSKQRVHIVLEASKTAGPKGDVPKICGFVHPL